MTGDRANEGKPKMSLLLEAPEALRGVVRVLEMGMEKYARVNWRKGLSYNELMDSMMRHQVAFMQGEDIDPESNLPHVDHILCNALFLSEMTRIHPEHDDRAILQLGKKPGPLPMSGNAETLVENGYGRDLGDVRSHNNPPMSGD